jgi:putative tryptophan/tyrosine transport system substrate-binding protein
MSAAINHQTRPLGSKSARRTIAGGVLLAFALGVYLPMKAQTPHRRVLILNSDRSVEKYEVAQAAFESTIDAQTIDVDLAARRLSETQLRRMLQAEMPTAIYCIGSDAYQQASSVARDQTIVMSSVINWQRFPSRRNTLVIASELPAESQLTMFRYFFPSVKRLGVLYSSEYNREWMTQAVSAGRDVGVEVTGESVRRSSSVARELRALLPRVDALWITADPVVLTEETIAEIFRQCHEAKKPVFAYSPAFADLGATLMVSPDFPTIGRQAAGLLQSSEPGGTVQSPAGSEIILNLRTIKEYALEFNPEALDSVNSVIR